MTSVAVKDLKGKSVGEITVSDKVFGIEPNTHVVHLALQRQLANARAGTACTKTRAEVRGGGRKPWRQKGTGRARAGSIRSPLWEGGGVIFGPKPRDYSQSMNRKTRRLALRSMLSARLSDTIVVQNFDELLGGSSDDPAKLPAPKTRNMCNVLKQFGLCDKTVLLVLNKTCPRAALVERAARNIEGLKVIDFTNLNVKDLAYHDVIMMTEGTLKAIDARFSCADEAAATCTAEGKSESSKKETTAEPKAPAKAKKAPAEKPAEEKAKAPRAKKKSSEE